MKIGIVFGCFIPMHLGHVNMINRAQEENEKVILGICGFKNDRGKDFLPFNIRQKLIKEKFETNNNIILSVVDDKKIGLEGKFDEMGWKIWSDEFFKNANIDPYNENDIFTWYTGEQRYIDEIKKTFPNHKFTLLDRNDINISGTQIRTNFEDNKQYIEETFLDYLERNKNK